MTDWHERREPDEIFETRAVGSDQKIKAVWHSVGNIDLMFVETAQVTILQHRIAELEAALRPFIESAKAWSDGTNLPYCVSCDGYGDDEYSGAYFDKVEHEPGCIVAAAMKVLGESGET